MIDFGERELRRRGRDANIALQRQFAAATDRITADRGHERLLTVEYLEFALLALADMRKIADAGCADAERRGITTGAKRFTFASQQNGADRGIVLRSGDRFAKGGAHRIVHCIMAIGTRSEEHTSELQSLMRNSYA